MKYSLPATLALLLISPVTCIAEPEQGVGTIIIIREVAPRIAYRDPVTPSRNVVSVDTFPMTNFENSVRGLTGAVELSDGDYAAVNSGNTLSGSLYASPIFDGTKQVTSLGPLATGKVGGGIGASHGGGIATPVLNATSQLAQQLSGMAGGKP